MYPFLARVGWFVRRSTPGWWTARSRTTAVLVAAACAAFFALVCAFILTFGLALACFLSVILAMGTHSRRRREGRGPPLSRSDPARLAGTRAGGRWDRSEG